MTYGVHENLQFNKCLKILKEHPHVMNYVQLLRQLFNIYHDIIMVIAILIQAM
jgi:hypothetical protein